MLAAQYEGGKSPAANIKNTAVVFVKQLQIVKKQNIIIHTAALYAVHITVWYAYCRTYLAII